MFFRLAALALLWQFPIAAQDCAVRVKLQDSTGASISEAEVKLETPDGKTAIAQTDSSGLAVLQTPCGKYSITASKSGFEQPDQKIVELSGPGTVDALVVLIPEALHEKVEVKDSAPAIDKSSSDSTQLDPNQVRDLPSRPATVTDTLPLLPGVARAPDGGIIINGTSEHRSAFIVNKADVTDPATGDFGKTIPVDSVQTLEVLRTPFLAQYGRFTAGVVDVETRRGGDKWHADLNDPLPDFRFRSWHMVGIRDDSPRFVFGGPIVANRLYFAETVQYDLDKTPERTLPYPYNESKKESVNSFAQLDYIISPNQFLTATLHTAPQHINFVNPQFFNPQPVTPSYRLQSYAGAFIHHLSLGRSLLESTITVQRFDATVGAQGESGMVLTPTGNTGNYFASQAREAGRTEWIETWAPAPVNKIGAHDIKLGLSAARTSDGGEFTSRPINVVDTSGSLLENISFVNQGPYAKSDLETALFAQDHWALTSTMVVDAGIRVERQNLAESVRVGPRVGFAWTPFGGDRTILRAGIGEFYDRVPLSVYAFDHYPERVVSLFAPDGSLLAPPITYLNLTGIPRLSQFPLIHGANEAGSFAPHSSTFNSQLEHSFSHLFRLRASFTDSNSAGLVTLQPQIVASSNALVLNGNGISRYRAAEITARFQWSGGQQLFFSYSRSRSQGDLNDFGSFLGNFPLPLIRPNMYSTLPGDLPNRFLAWGRVRLPWNMQILPMFEYRNGFPYARADALGNYVGVPNSTRFPAFFSADARIIKDIKVNPKYTLRFSVSGFNLTNHFNALAVHGNVADPQYGEFFGTYIRRFRADFDVVF